MSFRKKFIGTRAFYASVLALLVPMIVQQGITQFVNLLDNVMVGRLGTAPMSGVAIVNQIVFIFNLTIFGGFRGPLSLGPSSTARAATKACATLCGSGWCSAWWSPPWGFWCSCSLGSSCSPCT